MEKFLTISLPTLAKQLVAAAQRHNRSLMLASAGAVALATGGAFAVVSIAPSNAELPVYSVVQEIQVPVLSSLALDVTRNLSLHRSTHTRPSDTVDGVLARLGIVDAKASDFVRQDKALVQSLLAVGRLVKAESDARQQAKSVAILWPSEIEGLFNRTKVERTATGFSVRTTLEPFVKAQRFAVGTIQTSLFAATDDADIPDGVGQQIAEIFSGEVDFHRSLRRGDAFSVVYEALLADGEPLRSGKVLAAEFVNAGKVHQAVWFEASAGKGGYYTPTGQSLKKSFLASPMAFSRVTSGFAMRLHPIHNIWKAHLGVDYGAPTGTPVRSVGAGTVVFAGVKGGFGNVVEVDHGKKRITLYAHLSKIAVKKGQVIEQGDNLGAVGATGWATGPHLHFEFRVDGQHIDPLVAAKQAESATISAQLQPFFAPISAGMMNNLSAARTMVASNAQ
jgi:murein DD-endopeptidase MepM/ murein hydrolase activator NlpD